MSTRPVHVKTILAQVLCLALAAGLCPLAASAQAVEPAAAEAEAPVETGAGPATAPAPQAKDEPEAGDPQNGQEKPGGANDSDAAAAAEPVAVPPDGRQQAKTAAATDSAPPALVAEIEVHDADRAEPAGRRDVAQRVAAIGTALHAGDLDSAQRQLELLDAQLPARSLTLLRMQAWYAHASGDSAGAIALYRDIVARLPGDATSAINLAILEAGNGQPERARQRLRQLRAQDTGSHRIERAISRVEAQLK